MNVDGAKQFLKQKVLQQAQHDGIALRNCEIAMLTFSAVSTSSADIEASEQFESSCDSDEYETKVTRLLRRAYAADKKWGNLTEWNVALHALRNEDLYILVMARRAGLPVKQQIPLFTFRDVARFMPLGILGVGGLIMIFTPFGSRFLTTDSGKLIFYVVWLAALWMVGSLVK